MSTLLSTVLSSSVAGDFYAGFGLISLILGITAFVKKGSKPSLIAGGISGLLLLGAAWLTLKGDPATRGVIMGVIVSGLLTGRFLPAFLKSKTFYPAGLMAILSVIGLIVGILALV